MPPLPRPDAKRLDRRREVGAAESANAPTAWTSVAGISVVDDPNVDMTPQDEGAGDIHSARPKGASDGAAIVRTQIAAGAPSGAIAMADSWIGFWRELRTACGAGRGPRAAANPGGAPAPAAARSRAGSALERADWAQSKNNGAARRRARNELGAQEGGALDPFRAAAATEGDVGDTP